MRPLTLLLPLALLAAACAADPYAPSAGETSVKEGINDGFLAEDANVEQWVARFEDDERRDIAKCRDGIVAALDLVEG
ncbi:MAG: SAM-dependent methyltransferase, partial [Planctomycetes bacterium]|nr:SAM-dependent methyltransferase [Planctomycetota bacterium]